MITIEAYRASIGRFYVKATVCRNTCNFGLAHVGFLKTYGVICLILLVDLCLNTSFLKIMKVVIDGDVESNPGPTYNLLKSLSASYNQGHQKFGNTAGVQCACNSLFAICWSKIRKVTIWKVLDLDTILENGDQLYKELNKHGLLGVEDLPNTVVIYEQSFSVEMLSNESGILTRNYNIDSTSLLQLYGNCLNTGSGALFFLNNYTFSLIWNKQAFYLFDAHSRDKDGLITPDGTSILLKFKSLHEIQNYLVEAYLVKQDIQFLHFQIQFVQIEIDAVSTTQILNIFNKFKSKMCRDRDSIQRQQMLDSPQHEKTKDRKRKWASLHRQQIFGSPEHEKTKK